MNGKVEFTLKPVTGSASTHGGFRAEVATGKGDVVGIDGVIVTMGSDPIAFKLFLTIANRRILYYISGEPLLQHRSRTLCNELGGFAALSSPRNA